MLKVEDVRIVPHVKIVPAVEPEEANKIRKELRERIKKIREESRENGRLYRRNKKICSKS